VSPAFTLLSLLPILLQTVSPNIQQYTETKIKDSATPAAVYRLELDYNGPKTGPVTVILKRIQPEFSNDPGFPNREIHFYNHTLPRLDIPRAQVYYTGIAPDTQDRLILMEDLVDYYLPPPTRPWTQPEGECIARAYARFHVSGVQHLPPEGERAWLLPRHETRLQTENIGELAHDLFQRDVWDTIPEIDSLIEQTICNSRSLSQIPITLLHNDVFPPNVALPPFWRTMPSCSIGKWLALVYPKWI
jgi:hypothetical protein